jgi:uncharacterized membrane-anchored protein
MRRLICGFIFACVIALPTHPAPADDNAQDRARSETAEAKAARELHWIKGPQKVQLFDNSELLVPEGYVFLNPTDTAKLEELQHNLSHGTAYFLAPQDGRWEALFGFSDDGYVKDNEPIDADSILKHIQTSTEQGNQQRRDRGWDEMSVIGWQTPPHYDTQTNRLEWAVKGKDLKTNQVVVNFNTRILGRGGVMSAVVIANPEALTSSITEFKGTLSQFGYLPGQRYAEYKPGDKVAKYGLAALITGGAAAVAVKTGLWKIIVGAVVAGWKIVLAAFAALFAGITKFFKRKAV